MAVHAHIPPVGENQLADFDSPENLAAQRINRQDGNVSLFGQGGKRVESGGVDIADIKGRAVPRGNGGDGPAECFLHKAQVLFQLRGRDLRRADFIRADGSESGDGKGVVLRARQGENTRDDNRRNRRDRRKSGHSNFFVEQHGGANYALLRPFLQDCEIKIQSEGFARPEAERKTPARIIPMAASDSGGSSSSRIHHAWIPAKTGTR